MQGTLPSPLGNGGLELALCIEPLSAPTFCYLTQIPGGQGDPPAAMHPCCFRVIHHRNVTKESTTWRNRCSLSPMPAEEPWVPRTASSGPDTWDPFQPALGDL